MREFKSLREFITHLETMPAVVEEQVFKSVALGAEMIRLKAWEEIGHYQVSMGEFEEWPALRDSTRADRVRRGYEPDEPLLRSGALRASIQVKALGYEATIGSNDPKAVWQEQGTETGGWGGGGIPARSFLGTASFQMSHIVAEMVGSRVAWVMSGNRPADS